MGKTARLQLPLPAVEATLVGPGTFPVPLEASANKNGKRIETETRSVERIFTRVREHALFHHSTADFRGLPPRIGARNATSSRMGRQQNHSRAGVPPDGHARTVRTRYNPWRKGRSRPAVAIRVATPHRFDRGQPMRS